jgi:hypothetical protein
MGLSESSPPVSVAKRLPHEKLRSVGDSPKPDNQERFLLPSVYSLLMISAVCNLAYKGIEIQRLRHPGWPYIAALLVAAAICDGAQMKAVVGGNKGIPIKGTRISNVWFARLAIIVSLTVTCTHIDVMRSCAEDIVQSALLDTMKSEWSALDTTEQIDFLAHRLVIPTSVRAAIVGRKHRIAAAIAQTQTTRKFTEIARSLDTDPRRSSVELVIGRRADYLSISATNPRILLAGYLQGWISNSGSFLLQASFLLIPYIMADLALCLICGFRESDTQRRNREVPQGSNCLNQPVANRDVVAG